MCALLRVLCTSAALALAATDITAQQSAPSSIRVAPEQVTFLGNPAGPQTAVLYGNPKEPALFVMRVRFPAGFKVMPHWHPDQSRTAVVLSGTFYFGLGEQWDETKLMAFPAGTFFSEPAKTPHFAWAKDGEVIVQITSIGPTGTVNIEPPKQ